MEWVKRGKYPQKLSPTEVLPFVLFVNRVLVAAFCFQFCNEAGSDRHGCRVFCVDQVLYLVYHFACFGIVQYLYKIHMVSPRQGHCSFLFVQIFQNHQISSDCYAENDTLPVTPIAIYCLHQKRNSDNFENRCIHMIVMLY